MLRYRALVIDPEYGNRHRLHALMSASGQFEQITLIDPAAPRPPDLDLFDLAFVSYALGAELIRRTARDCKRKQVAVVLLVPDRFGGACVTSSVMDRVDGILARPYSLPSLLAGIRMAERTRALKYSRKVRKAMAVLAAEVRDLQSSLARSGTEEGSVTSTICAELGTLVRSFNEDLLAEYHRAILTEYIGLQPHRGQIRSRLEVLRMLPPPAGPPAAMHRPQAITPADGFGSSPYRDT